MIGLNFLIVGIHITRWRSDMNKPKEYFIIKYLPVNPQNKIIKNYD